MIQQVLPLFDPCRLIDPDPILNASDEYEACLPDGVHGRFCQRLDLPDLVRSIGGLRYPDRRLHWESNIVLPTTIASLKPGRLLRLAPLVFGNVLALKYTDIGGLMRLDIQKVASWRTRNGIPDEVLIVLHQESNDPLLERLFKASRDERFYRLLSLLGRVLLIAPGYSVYSDGRMCRVHQRFNIERSAEFAERASYADLAVAPTWGWDDEHQRKAHVEWLARNPMPYVALNGQTGSKVVHEMARELALIESESGHRPSWIVFGGRSALHSLLKAGNPSDRLVHITTEPFRYTLFHRLIGGSRETIDTPQPQLLAQNWAREIQLRQGS